MKWAGLVARVGVLTVTNGTLTREIAVERECGRPELHGQQIYIKFKSPLGTL